MTNIPALLCIDSYKLGHIHQYPENTEYVYSNMTPRSLHHFNAQSKFSDNKLVAFGMHAAVKELHDNFNRTFFSRPINEVLQEFNVAIAPFLGDNTFPVEYLRKLHTYGRLPLHIKALDEGTVLGPNIPVLTLVNTHPDFFWLTNYIETWLSAALWKTMTSASIARIYRLILDHYAHLTGTDLAFVDWQGHDFSTRGMSGIQDSASTGSGHLLFFTGTDNIPATYFVAQNYETNGLIGASIPATEHSVMCMGGQEDELLTYARLITELYPTGMVAIVSDTWDFWRVMTEYTVQLKDEILSRGRDSLGVSKVVFRPDSGNPEDVICGTAIHIKHQQLLDQIENIPPGVYKTERGYFRITLDTFDKIEPTPEMMGAVECLWNVFGGHITNTGHKQLDEHVGIIYGDSITLARAASIMDGLYYRGYASGNVVFGIGSYTYQYITRDTLGTAMKATWGVIDGVPKDIFKDPITDNGIKKSAKGLLSVSLNKDDEFVLYQQVTREEEDAGCLKTIYADGYLNTQKLCFDTIRATARG
jgi:nicotinamide phosphoribosyltransferase